MEKKTVVGIKREALFIPRRNLPRSLVETLIDDNTISFYQEKACNKCEYFQDRHCEICDNCAAFTGRSELAQNVVINEKKYLKLPLGTLNRIQNQFNRYDINLQLKSKHKIIPIKPFKFTGSYKEWQPDAIKALIKGKRGVLKSPPRSGKTVMCAAGVAKLSLKTLIIASQREWLDGFLETFIGSETQKALTNINPKRIGFCRKLEDFEKHDICLVTVQTFYSESGQKLLKKIRSKFSIIICDEAQTNAARLYIKILSQFNAPYIWCVSGTPSRKDQRFILVNKIVGGLLHATKVPRLKPKIELVQTKYKQKQYKGGYVPWHYLVSGLENDKGRLELIAKHAISDAKKGHLVLIPLSRRKAINTLIKIINKQANKTIAHPFHGSLKKEVRKQTVENARQFKIRILVGQVSLMDTGINIPRASCLYECVLSNNKEKCEQRISRILTVYDKPDPIVKIFLDDANVRRKCLAAEWFSTINPVFRPIVSNRDNEILKNYFRSKTKDRDLFYTEI